MKRKVLDSMTQFAFKLHSALCDTVEKDSNAIFSPASIYAALAMTFSGARGHTAEELMLALGIEDNPEFHKAFSKIWLGIQKAHNNSDLNVVNRLWLQKDYPVEKEFSDTLVEYYSCDVGYVDFKSNPKNAGDTINAWVEEKTNKIVKNIVDEGSVTFDTRVIITNSIYFHGDWLYPFSTCNTEEMPFFTDTQHSCKVQMMYQKEKFGYVDDEDFNCNVLVLRYDDSSLRMLIVLPNEIDGLANLEKQLNADGGFDDILDDWISTGNQPVKAYLPKFHFSRKYDLVKSLRTVGITDLFCSNSDLSGITINPASMDSITHQAFIEVNEEGTEVCAVTGSTIRASSMRTPPIFKADHPFLFFIIDSDTSVILFWGRCCNPS